MATIAPRSARTSAERRFFAITAAAMVLVIAIGFAPTFYLRGYVPNTVRDWPLTGLVVAHGLVFTAWLLLYVSQIALVSIGRIDLHRRLGNAAFAMLPLLIVLGLLSALYGVGRPFTAAPGVPPLSWLALPLLDVPMWTALIWLALRNRWRPAVHKRLMYLALTVMMVPGLGRFPVPPAYLPVMTVVAPSLFLIALIAWDIRSLGQPMRVTLIGSGAVLALWIAKPAVWGTAAWLAFAGWVSAPFT